MIKKEEVKHIAKLARLGISEKEAEKFQKELSSILEYFNSLKEVDASKAEPTFHPAERFFERKTDIMREDKEKPQPVGLADKLIKMAPDKKERHIKVKAVF